MNIDIDMQDIEIAAGRLLEFGDQLTKRCSLTPYSLILEAGCGTGKLGMNFASRMNSVVVLLDIDNDALARTFRYLAAVEGLFARRLPVLVRRGDILKLPFHDGTFDLVFNEGVIEHFADPKVPLKEMARVSAAWVGAIVPNARNKTQADMAKLQMERHEGTDRWEAYEKPMTQEELEDHLTRIGLGEVQTTLLWSEKNPPTSRDDYRMVMGIGKKTELMVR